MEKDRPKLEFEDREIVLRADFDRLDDEHCIETSMRFLISGPRAPQEGEWVYLLDTRGNGCLGQVASIIGWTARVRPDWDSWTGNEPRPV